MTQIAEKPNLTAAEQAETARVKVKPLEWETYKEIGFSGDKTKYFHRAYPPVDGPYWIEMHHLIPGFEGHCIYGSRAYREVEEAKAAAQADYERRILAALETQLAERAGVVNEDALEAAVLAHDKEEAAMRGEPDPWADERPDGEFADRKAAMAEAIRAYLSALPSSPVSELVERLDTCAVATFPIVQEAATTLTDLEAENAKLKAEVERLEKADETRAQDISRLTIERDAARDRLAEALKALDDAADALDRALEDVSHWGSYASEYFQDKHGLQIDLDRIKEQAAAARRVREGGKVE